MIPYRNAGIFDMQLREDETMDSPGYLVHDLGIHYLYCIMINSEDH